MIRIRTSRYPDGQPYLQVDLPPLSDPQLYLLDCVVDALWRILAPPAGPTAVSVARAAPQSSRAQPATATPDPLNEKSPRAATLGPRDPSHPSTVKGVNR